MIGEFIVDRYAPKIVSDLCAQHGISVKTFSDDWIVRMQKDDHTEWLIGYSFSLNSAGGSRIAEDKVATYLILQDANLPAIDHYLTRTYPGEMITMDYLSEVPKASAYVLKPLMGSSGRGIIKQSSLEEVVSTVNKSSSTRDAISPYYDIRSEKRFIILDGELLLAIEKINPQTIDGVLFYNLGQGAVPVTIEATDFELDLARNAAKACSLRVAAVDIVTLADGSQRILEVNSGFMLEHYMRHSPENLERGRDVYEKIIDRLFA